MKHANRKETIKISTPIGNRHIDEFQEEDILFYTDKQLDSCNVIPKGTLIEFEGDSLSFGDIKNSIITEKRREMNKRF
jgi:hypothetical protein